MDSLDAAGGLAAFRCICMLRLRPAAPLAIADAVRIGARLAEASFSAVSGTLKSG